MLTRLRPGVFVLPSVASLVVAACAGGAPRTPETTVAPAPASAVRIAIGRELQRWIEDASGIRGWLISVSDTGDGASLSFLDAHSQPAADRRDALRTALEERVERVVSERGNPSSLTGHGMLAAAATPAQYVYESDGFRGGVFVWVGSTEKGQTMVTICVHEVR